MINFCFDRIVNFETKEVYPNLAPKIEGDFYDIKGLFSQIKPYSDTPRLLEYMTQENINYNIYLTNDCPTGSFYFINVNFFDHSIDWFSLMPEITLHKIKNNKINVLFFYCEADSPYQIKQTLHYYALKHDINIDQIHFISHSTIAKQLKNFYYFNDDEFLYKNAQDYSKSQSPWTDTKSKTFTFLIRSHKNWRLIAGSDFYNNQYHNISYTSYNGVNFADGFSYADNFTDTDQNPLWNDNVDETVINKFKKIIPYSADTLSDNEHNNYETHVDKFYTNSYWNIVCETHIDISNTNGTFITEKTWKPIRHNQPFIILGTVHSLRHLREMGYKTFDNVIDESYDDEVDPIKRYNKIKDVLATLASKSSQELQEINRKVKDAVIHNSSLFNRAKPERITTLLEQLNYT